MVMRSERTKQFLFGCNHVMQVVLEVKSQQQLENLSSKLADEGILHKLWIEQPEDYPTCLATKPYRRSQAAPFLKSISSAKQLWQQSSNAGCCCAASKCTGVHEPALCCLSAGPPDV